ncbi:MAG: hypothetical protein BWY72_02096 [Bacteroidetes bacterium ADurb.Bin416]|nr:MAG: hypothetical protein BWY72_02096 [Bacteroidetes bacterium ADurb.Bin416]
MYPTKKPNTVCIYRNPFSLTMPGTEMKLTPETDVPIMPMATTYQGEV